jgi:D-xylose transport system permease protein
MTLIILTGGIDLSVGSVVALCGVAVGISQVSWGWAQLGVVGAVYSSLLALAVGTVCGFCNGSLIAFLRLPPFVITLGMMVVARGLALILSGGASISPMGETMDLLANAYFSLPFTIALLVLILGFFIWNSKRSKLTAMFPLLTLALFSAAFIHYRGFPVLAFFLLLSLGSVAFVLRYTSFGRSLYAIGSNERAAFWAGVPIRPVTVAVYSVMGFAAGLAGLLLTARLNGSDPNAGQLFELDAIAATVIGGTSLKGGQGSAMGTFVGALMIASLNNGMDLMGVPSFYQMVGKGLIIVIAVSLDQSQRKA